MKYWVYLNDAVSQKSYFEEELKQLEGFGPDVLICSEVSAVSREPEWLPVKEVLPHLIRPKAPDFAKFRPQPPVVAVNAQNKVVESLPQVKNEEPFTPKPQVVNPDNNVVDNSTGLNNELLAQLKSLTAKIAALESKIEEQEMPLSNSAPNFEQEYEEDETFVSDPKNEKEDDVLEVPFDSDFEVPFDANKSSEEIVKEAEAMLANPATMEIEEYNADDQSAELMNYDSEDMQKILEDTIRETNTFVEKPKTTEPKADKGTFIAEDLISKKTLKFTGKLGLKDKQETKTKDEKKDNAKDNKQPGNSEKTDKNVQAEESKNTSVIDSGEKQELISEQQSKEEQKEVAELKDEEKQEDFYEQPNQVAEQEGEQEIPQEEEQEIPQEEQPKSEVKSLDELLKSEGNKEEKEEETEEHQGDEETEDVKAHTLLPTLEDGDVKSKEKITEEKDEEKEVEEKPQLSSLDNVITVEEHVKEAEPIEKGSGLPSLDDIPAQKEEQALEEQEETQTEQENLPSDEEKQKEPQAEPKVLQNDEATLHDTEEKQEQEQIKEELKDIPVEKDKVVETEEVLDTDKVAETEEVQEEENNLEENKTTFDAGEDDYLKTIALDEVSTDIDSMTQQLQVAESKEEDKEEKKQTEDKQEEVSETKEEVQENVSEQQIEKTQEEIENEEIRKIIEGNQEVYSTVGDTENSEVLDESSSDNNPNEQTSNLAITQNVTISNDDTTAAILNEIAQEKAQNTVTVTTSEKLFEELESNNNEENNGIKQLLGEDAPNSEDALEEDLGKEDEFLKTFTTSVEEVFLDQPTAMISDYVPPSTDGAEHAAPVAMENNIKREKPSDIKTVPLVPEALGQEIYSSPYVDSATAKLRRASLLSGFIKWILVMLVIAAIAVMVLAFLAVKGIVNEKFSPIHTVISLKKSSKEKPEQKNEDLAPEMIEQVMPEEQIRQATQKQAYAAIDMVKDYAFSDGTTLKSRIENSHKNLEGNISWSLFPTEEQNVYSVTVKIPQDSNGQGFSYLFNYNMNENTLTPTTPESKNIIENYSK